ncbi:MAG TPA: YdcF family protein [Rhodanobacteraceae bacterium]|nr:YdcF family protein [Rhodanobacteraceae bacterium]
MLHVPLLFRRGPFRYLADGDVWHSLIVTALACVLSAGVLYLVYLVRVARIAAHASCSPQGVPLLLVFGRRLGGNGKPEREYIVRLQRALAVLAEQPASKLMLLGGASGAQISEAAAGLRWLHAHGLPVTVEVTLEQASTDSLENLRHARSLLGAPLPDVALISSRYHLARCFALARALGFPAQACAAEARLHCSARTMRRIALEAGYLMWLQTGSAWARLIGNKRMLSRVT